MELWHRLCGLNRCIANRSAPTYTVAGCGWGSGWGRRTGGGLALGLFLYTMGASKIANAGARSKLQRDLEAMDEPMGLARTEQRDWCPGGRGAVGQVERLTAGLGSNGWLLRLTRRVVLGQCGARQSKYEGDGN